METRNSCMSSHKDQILLSKRQASMIMASMIIVSLFVFITGYFLGKRTVMNDFSSNVTQAALHDQIDYLLTAQSLETSSNDNTNDVDDSIATHEQEEKVEKIESPEKNDIVHEPYHALPAKSLQKEEVLIVSPEHGQDVQKDQQYACLIGFGTKAAANAFVARLKKHHVSVILKTIISKSASGKTRTWFQAITPTYDSAQELHTVVNKVKRLEHIRDNDIKIVHVK